MLALAEHNSGSPGTKRNAIVETPGENSMNAKGDQAGKGRGKRRERQYTFDTEQQKQGKGESRAGRHNVPPYAAGQGAERENEKKEWNRIRTVQPWRDMSSLHHNLRGETGVALAEAHRGRTWKAAFNL